MSFPWAYHISFPVRGWCRSTPAHTQISQGVITMAALPAAGASGHQLLSVQCDCWGLGHWDLGAGDLMGQCSLHSFLWDTSGMSPLTMSAALGLTLEAPSEPQQLQSCQQQLPSKEGGRAESTGHAPGATARGPSGFSHVLYTPTEGPHLGNS